MAHVTITPRGPTLQEAAAAIQRARNRALPLDNKRLRKGAGVVSHEPKFLTPKSKFKRPGKRGKHKFAKWTKPLFQRFRYKGLKGGRGGSKSHTVMEIQLLLQVANPDRRVVFIREVQKSLKDSVKALLEDKIKKLKLSAHFLVLNSEIRMTRGDGVILFVGMSDHTAATIKSIEGMDCAVVEEAQTISERSLEILLPTIRKAHSEVWFMWNPLNITDPIDKLFHGEPKIDDKTGRLPVPLPVVLEDSVLIEVSYRDNRFASRALKLEAERVRKADPQKYAHIYGGGYEEHSEARIFKNWRIESFETPDDAFFLFGLDWGFSTDPLVLLRGFIIGRTLYIDHEAVETGVEIRDTRAFLLQIPGSSKWTITAGRERPERIRDINFQGFKVRAAIGGNDSEIEGIEYLQDLEIVVHTRCLHTADELTSYKHPLDKVTQKVLPILPKVKNHLIEAMRYMVEDHRRVAQNKKPPKRQKPPKVKHYWTKTKKGMTVHG
jgi:phage terminase large subunit